MWPIVLLSVASCVARAVHAVQSVAGGASVGMTPR